MGAGNQIDTISSYSAAAGLPAPGSASASTIAISSALPPRPIHSAHSLFVADPSSDSFVFESPGLSSYYQQSKVSECECSHRRDDAKKSQRKVVSENVSFALKLIEVLVSVAAFHSVCITLFPVDSCFLIRGCHASLSLSSVPFCLFVVLFGVLVAEFVVFLCEHRSIRFLSPLYLDRLLYAVVPLISLPNHNDNKPTTQIRTRILLLLLVLHLFFLFPSNSLLYPYHFFLEPELRKKLTQRRRSASIIEQQAHGLKLFITGWCP